MYKQSKEGRLIFLLWQSKRFANEELQLFVNLMNSLTDSQREYYSSLVPEWRPVKDQGRDPGERYSDQHKINMVLELVYQYARDNILVVDVFITVSAEFMFLRTYMPMDDFLLMPLI